MSDIKPLNWTTKTLALLSYLSLGFQVIYAGRSCPLSRQGHCIPMLASGFSLSGMRSGWVWRHGRLTIRGHPRSPHFSMAIYIYIYIYINDNTHFSPKIINSLHSPFFMSLHFWTFRHHASKTFHLSSLTVTFLTLLKYVICRGKSLAPLQAVDSTVWLSYWQRNIYRYLFFVSWP